MLDTEQRDRMLDKLIQKYDLLYKHLNIPYAIASAALEIRWANSTFEEIYRLPQIFKKNMRESFGNVRDVLSDLKKGNSLSSHIPSPEGTRIRAHMVPMTEDGELIAVIIYLHTYEEIMNDKEYRSEEGLSKYLKEISQKTTNKIREVYLLTVPQESDSEDEKKRKALICEKLAAILGNTLDTQRTITNYIKMNQAVKGKLETANEDTEINQVLNSLCQRLHEDAQKTGTSFTYTLPEFPPIINCNIRLLKEGIIALVSNSLYFATGREISLLIEDLKGSMRVVVADNGPGIRLDRLDKMLLPGYSYAPLKGEMFSGGMGLSSLNEQLKQMKRYEEKIKRAENPFLIFSEEEEIEQEEEDAVLIETSGIDGVTVSFEMPYTLVSELFLENSLVWDDSGTSDEYQIQMVHIMGVQEILKKWGGLPPKKFL